MVGSLLVPSKEIALPCCDYKFSNEVGIRDLDMCTEESYIKILRHGEQLVYL